MSTRGDRLRQMEDEVARFRLFAYARDKNHKQYLSEALQYLRSASDSLAVLRFLDSLMSSPFARRPQQKQALGDVGEWLGGRMLREPNLDRDTLAYELGWMQRLVVIRQAQVPGNQAHSAHTPAPQGQQAGFRSKIEAIEKRRSADVVMAQVRAKREPPKAPPRIAPERLPEVFEAEFVNLDAARDARRKAREREKARKPKKPVWIALKPVDGLLAVLAKDLGCMLDTTGYEAVLDDIAKHAGTPRAFWVADVHDEAGRLVVGRIELELPQEEKKA